MIDKAIEKYWAIAQENYPALKKYPAPAWKFAKLGKTAGRAYDSHRIEINEIMFNENKAAFLVDTIPHEVAHCVVYRAYEGRKQPHGAEWKRVMVEFGVKPERCHSYSTRNASRLKIFDYQCDCKDWEFTSIRHNRVKKGVKYTCPKCKSAITEKENVDRHC